MSNKKLKGFKFHLELLDQIRETGEKFKQPDTTIVESALEHFFSLPETKQKELIKKFLTKNL